MMRFLLGNQSRRLSCAALAVGLALCACVNAANFDDGYREKTWEQLSDKEISDWGLAALQVNRRKWRHGETRHFVIHFFRNGEKVARRCEEFYFEIRGFFGNRDDVQAGRSHVFAFRDADDWSEFVGAIGLGSILGVTRRDEFFYLSTGEDGRFDSKAKVQAHEMTHLVFNRFFRGQVPLWLNEGIAEYFGQRKTSSLVEFRRTMGQTPKYDIDDLFARTRYPRTVAEVQGFYAESAIVVDFLTKNEEGRILLPRFVDAMIKTNDIAEALALYGYRNLGEFKDTYRRYRRRF